MNMGGGRGPKLNPSTDVAGLSGLVIVILWSKKRGGLVTVPPLFYGMF
jgi:hypothetical protein